jgi:hypothetical protein
MGLRRGLALAVCLAVALGWLAAYALKFEDRLLIGANDFLQLYSGAKLARTPQLYDAEASWQIQRQVVGFRLPSVVPTRPPSYYYLLQPFAWLHYRTAYWLFLSANFLGLSWFCWRFFAGRLDYALLVACFPPLYVAILGGNDLGLVLALLGASILLLEKGRDTAAGLLLSLCAIKFHLFLLLPTVFWILGRRRVLGGGALGGALLVFLSYIAQGFGWPARYLTLLRKPVIHPLVQTMPNLHGLFVALLPTAPLVAILAASILVAAVLLWIVWMNRSDWRTSLAYALLGGLLLSWHSYIQDAVLLLPVLALLLQGRFSAVVKISLSLAFVPFTFWMLTAGPPWSAVPALVLLAALAGALAGSAPLNLPACGLTRSSTCSRQERNWIVKQPPSPGGIHDAGRPAQTFSQRGNRLEACASGRWPEHSPGSVPEFQDLRTSEGGPGCNGFPNL